MHQNIKFVIKRTDGRYLTQEHASTTYTHNLKHARLFELYTDAMIEKMPHAENIISIKVSSNASVK